MKKTLLLLSVGILLSVFLYRYTDGSYQKIKADQVIADPVPELQVSEPVPLAEIVDPYKLSNEQNVWLDKLNFCESGGDNAAINKVDLDGTSSYYSYQFKPSTFKAYGVKYGLIKGEVSHSELMELLKDQNLQRAIVGRMIFDNTIKWHIQFPDCVKKLGIPPK